eukprot:2194160-Karenia_brevis.AAC.1
MEILAKKKGRDNGSSVDTACELMRAWMRTYTHAAHEHFPPHVLVARTGGAHQLRDHVTSSATMSMAPLPCHQLRYH